MKQIVNIFFLMILTCEISFSQSDVYCLSANGAISDANIGLNSTPFRIDNTATGLAVYSNRKTLKHLPSDLQPVIGAWFWNEDVFKPDGYKYFLDQIDEHSCYDLLSTGIRVPGRDITDIDVHNQVKLAVEYAKEKGIKMALELDPRIARRKFEARYPKELQKSLWLKEVSLSGNKSVETVIHQKSLTDHMTGMKTPYISLGGSLLRVYSYYQTKEEIDPSTLKDITTECKVTVSSNDSLVVCLPVGNDDLKACVMVSFDLLYPDIFSPHLIGFTQEIIKDYADIPLAGGMWDEWGFPPSNGLTSGNHFWYSKYYDEAYAKKTGGRDLIFDCLLMYKGVKGKEGNRQMAINNYLELNRQRNEELEGNFYNTIKAVFGKDAAVVTHPTWYPYPNKMEYKKNGLDWWVAKRDWAQTDEITPFAARTSLSKKWGSPVWYNQYYSTERKDYERELWSSVLAGGRLNYHPIYPNRNGLSKKEKYARLFRGKLMLGQSRVRLLNFISDCPLDCPVAVIFGHPATMNWAGPYFNDAGVNLSDSLWSIGIKTDLIPTSEIENGSLVVDSEGWIHYGKQRYRAVILYHPEFEKSSTAKFFKKAANGQTHLFRIGNWTRDFNGNIFNGNDALPREMVDAEDIKALVPQIFKIIKKSKTGIQTPSKRELKGFGTVSKAPSTQGYCRLTDGTLIQVAGTNDVSGDLIDSKKKIGKYNVSFNAEGVAAVKLDENGQVQTLAAGGLKFFKSGKFVIQLDQRIDLALWRNDEGKFEGVIQGYEGEIPQQLLSITKDWLYLRKPLPLIE